MEVNSRSHLQGGPLKGVPAPTKGLGMMCNFPPLEPGKEQGPPEFFVRAAGAVGRAGEPIVMPRRYGTVLYEGELVVVIGKRARAVTPAEARECIAGYTCGMDGSPLVLDAKGERDPARSLAGKSADGIAPVGPELVRSLKAEGHDIILRRNGKEVERANTRDLIWDPPRMVSELSQRLTLEPGDVIFSGARRAIEKMEPGDTVEVEIEGIGVLCCPVVAPR
jgi:2-keto-4-pentenoate hydratase/2-oxohepta-3-ene-1,7-dioic acid hydratase in catechol pathway